MNASLKFIIVNMKTIIITGGAGFIGSHVVREFVNKYPDYRLVNLDALTYAGNLENLKDIEHRPNYEFVKADIRDAARVMELFEHLQPEGVIHLAAESHVDRSIADPTAFVTTNVLGTVNLLNAARAVWKTDLSSKRFLHVSTDEVYGSLGPSGLFTEETKYDPHSPYSASKAASDHFVRAYHDTYGLPVVITNCSNNYGPNQFPEKLIPLCIHNILQHQPLPIYGDGLYTRDWLYVIDHARAIDLVYHRGRVGESYNVGGFNEWTNIDLVRELCRQVDEKRGRKPGTAEQLITFVTDRPGHDLRYAIDATKIQTELGYQPSVTFEQGLGLTIDWYLENRVWLEQVTSGGYKQYYDTQYSRS